MSNSFCNQRYMRFRPDLGDQQGPRRGFDGIGDIVVSDDCIPSLDTYENQAETEKLYDDSKIW